MKKVQLKLDAFLCPPVTPSYHPTEERLCGLLVQPAP